MMPLNTAHKQALWIGLLGLVVIYVAALLAETLRIERSIEQQVEVALATAGLGRVTTEVRGRDVALRGSVSSIEGEQQALALAGSVEGVRVVVPQLQVNVRQLPWIRLRNGVLEGRLPRSALLEQVLQQLAGRGIAVESGVVLDADLGAPDWVDLVDSLAEVVSELDSPLLEVGAGRAVVGGRLPPGVQALPRINRLQTLASSYGIRVVNRLAAMP